MTESPGVLHIVRRYGPVGGMEGYVWQLTQRLAGSGCQVGILCETQHEEAHPSIRIHQLGSIRKKPRWLAALRFSRRARQWLKNHPYRLIHSHESTDCHHVITFHGPPFAQIRQQPLWRRLSLRVQANLRLEKRMLCSPRVRIVIPNSELIRERLHAFYPCIGPRMHHPIPPGVESIPERPPRTLPELGGIVGFVGREWKRKGLDIAVSIVERMRQARPNLELHVVGPAAEDVRHLFAGWKNGYRLLGETDARPCFRDFDLLLHPARMEPFGMVVTEALAARVPVLVSDQCGACSEVSPQRVLPLSETPETWAATALAILGKPQQPYRRDWNKVASEHIRLYRDILQHAG